MKDETKIIHTRIGRGPINTVNPPIERGSTVLLPTRGKLYGDKRTYGRMGTTVQRELEAALCTLENASHCRLTANGLQACALAVGAVLKAGDHLLLSDCIYGPTNRFCTRRLEAMGVSSTRFNPLIGGDVETLIQPNTKAILLESPGSLTFDIMDTPAITAVAKRNDLITLFDNTWGFGMLHRPLDLGVDIVIQALTKYPVGHADAMGGAVLTSGLLVAHWLEARPEVERVLHPGLVSHPEHALWKRDFSGSNGLFGFVLKETPTEKLDHFLEALHLFGMGFSWGGYESLIIPCDDQLDRIASDRIESRSGPLMRIHIGLEDPQDLLDDLDQAFATIQA